MGVQGQTCTWTTHCWHTREGHCPGQTHPHRGERSKNHVPWEPTWRQGLQGRMRHRGGWGGSTVLTCYPGCSEATDVSSLVLNYVVYWFLFVFLVVLSFSSLLTLSRENISKINEKTSGWFACYGQSPWRVVEEEGSVVVRNSLSFIHVFLHPAWLWHNTEHPWKENLLLLH